MSRKIWICLGLILLLCTIVFALIVKNYTMRNVGKIKTIGFDFYSNPECTDLIIEIDWGELRLNQTHNKTGYLKNTGNVDVNTTMYTDTWNPLEAEYAFTVTWDSEGLNVLAGESIPVIITLETTNDHLLVQNFTDFSFYIHLVAIGE